MKVEIISIFPRMFDEIFHSGMIGQAIKKNLLAIKALDLRDFTDDKHRTVDDRPFGGGEGMVLKPGPLFRAVEFCREADQTSPHIVLMSPQGCRFDQTKAKELSLKTRLILICGRYEGIDQRVSDHLTDEEISIGDYVLSGGELAAAVVVDAVSRLIPGVVRRSESVLAESFMDGLLDYPHYTRPADFRGWRAPDVLLSGDHEQIREWRERQALLQTRCRRPDLLTSATSNSEENEDESG
ncbi:MAG TPA: tRNA (guanosine(37)-N1)-methyltransferase TrmD [Acidobacteriota bacterium]|nr:tRNA (guanosine(37)-N1)-methyltransferase TrmD [Acidobacteriota bacterium]